MASSKQVKEDEYGAILLSMSAHAPPLRVVVLQDFLM